MSAPEERPTVAGALVFTLAGIPWLVAVMVSLLVLMEGGWLSGLLGLICLAICGGGPLALRAVGCSLAAGLAISAFASVAVMIGFDLLVFRLYLYS